MKLEVTYENTRFSEVAIRNTIAKFDELFKTPHNLNVQHSTFRIVKDDQTWDFDKEDEFFAHYSDCDMATYRRQIA